MPSYEQPWHPTLNWETPAGRVLDRLVAIDVGRAIIAPALAERRRNYAQDPPKLRDALRRAGEQPDDPEV